MIMNDDMNMTLMSELHDTSEIPCKYDRTMYTNQIRVNEAMVIH